MKGDSAYAPRDREQSLPEREISIIASGYYTRRACPFFCVSAARIDTAVYAVSQFRSGDTSIYHRLQRTSDRSSDRAFGFCFGARVQLAARKS